MESNEQVGKIIVTVDLTSPEPGSQLPDSIGQTYVLMPTNVGDCRPYHALTCGRVRVRVTDFLGVLRKSARCGRRYVCSIPSSSAAASLVLPAVQPWRELWGCRRDICLPPLPWRCPTLPRQHNASFNFGDRSDHLKHKLTVRIISLFPIKRTTSRCKGQRPSPAARRSFQYESPAQHAHQSFLRAHPPYPLHTQAQLQPQARYKARPQLTFSRSGSLSSTPECFTSCLSACLHCRVAWSAAAQSATSVLVEERRSTADTHASLDKKGYKEPLQGEGRPSQSQPQHSLATRSAGECGSATTTNHHRPSLK